MNARDAFVTRHERGDALPTHRHRSAYAALVLDGTYVQTSVDVRVRPTAGARASRMVT
jgi:hypothetical protein